MRTRTQSCVRVRVRLLFPRALVDFLRLVVVGLEEIRDEIDGQWEDDRRVLLRGNGVQRLRDKRGQSVSGGWINV